MRIKIFADTSFKELEKQVNCWIIQNEDEHKITDIIYKFNDRWFSVLIQYK